MTAYTFWTQGFGCARRRVDGAQRTGAPLRRISGRLAYRGRAVDRVETARALRRPQVLATLDAACDVVLAPLRSWKPRYASRRDAADRSRSWCPLPMRTVGPSRRWRAKRDSCSSTVDFRRQELQYEIVIAMANCGARTSRGQRLLSQPSTTAWSGHANPTAWKRGPHQRTVDCRSAGGSRPFCRRDRALSGRNSWRQIPAGSNAARLAS